MTLEAHGGDAVEAAAAAEALAELLETIVLALRLDAQVTVTDEEGVITGRVDGDDLGLFIGRHGQTINAVQHLAQRIVLRGAETALRVLVDADGYRDRRAEVLREEADAAAAEAVRRGRPVELPAMTALERRLVHEHLRDRPDVETSSEGEEPERYLVVSPVG